MNCVYCKDKFCRDSIACNAQSADLDVVRVRCFVPNNQLVVESASKLVDDGRAGTLSRLEEIVEFYKAMRYRMLGLAYCYGMEKEAILVMKYFREKKLKAISVSCTTGSMKQNEVNKSSENENVSCNSVAQAFQLNSEGVDIAVTMGLCLGQDILFHKHIEADTTNLVVKDSVNNYSPIEQIRNLS